MDTFLMFEPGQRKPVSAPALALSAFNTFCSATPEAFEAKVREIPPERMCDTAIFLVDILRASTTLTAVGAAGVAAVKVEVKPTDGGDPFATPPTDTEVWIGGGEENGRPIDGAAVGNSPLEVQPSQFLGAYLRFLSSNGARAGRAAERAGSRDIYITCMSNYQAAVAAAVARCKRFMIACGGFYRSGTLEDTVCAGRIIEWLMRLGAASLDSLDDEALIALATARAYSDDEHLVRTLEGGQVGRLLSEIGRGEDIRAVVTGDGVHPLIRSRMASTVLRYDQFRGLGVFVPSFFEEFPS